MTTVQLNVPIACTTLHSADTNTSTVSRDTSHILGRPLRNTLWHNKNRDMPSTETNPSTVSDARVTYRQVKTGWGQLWLPCQVMVMSTTYIDNCLSPVVECTLLIAHTRRRRRHPPRLERLDNLPPGVLLPSNFNIIYLAIIKFLS